MSTRPNLSRVSRNVVDATIAPRIVALSTDFFGVAFSLMKLVPARYMLERANESGLLTANSTVVETTSGTFGMGLALVCRVMGWRLHLVSDAIVDNTFRARLTDLGAVVEIVAPDGNNPQQARLDRVQELLKERPETYYWPNQYDSPLNAEAYASVAYEITQAIGRVDALVGPVGSGGSMCGTVRSLRCEQPEMQAIAVDTPGSILFGHDDAPRMLRGLGNSVLPGNLHHEIFDEVHWVTAQEAFHATRDLHRGTGLFMGPTSGAAFMVARWWKEQHPTGRVAVLLPDDGSRYQATVYDDSWLESRGLIAKSASRPIRVDRAIEAPSTMWSWMRWDRRLLTSA